MCKTDSVKGDNSSSCETDQINEIDTIADTNQKGSEDTGEFKTVIVYRNVAVFIALHLGALYGLYLIFTEAMWRTSLFVFILHSLGGMGITAGAHRLWSHKSYKARFPVRFFLMILNTLAIQNDIIEWSRDHRTHHKFSETNADPHNANRGLFFSHVGWLLCRKHPDVIAKGKTIDMSDLLKDPILKFQRKYYKTLCVLVSIVIPTLVPFYFWGESIRVAYFTAFVLRYVITLNSTWTVNSLAHFFGSKPYDTLITPVQSLTAIIVSYGEGWHNYHHAFPFDYRASEYPWRINLTTMLIDFWAMIGLVYDRKAVSKETIDKKRLRSGQKVARLAYIYG